MGGNGMTDETAITIYQDQDDYRRNTELPSVSNTLQLEVHSPESKRAYKGDVAVFKDWLDEQGLDLAQVDYDTMLRYHAHLLETYAKATAARRFVVARRLLAVAVKRKVIEENPAAEIKSKIRRDESAAHTALSKSEAKSLLAAVDTTDAMGKRDYALLMLLIYGGLRRSECAAIRIKDIASKQEHVVLTIQSGKGDKRRDVPLRPDVFRSIRQYLEATGRTNDHPDTYLFTGFLKSKQRGEKPTRRGISDRQIANIVEGYAAKAGVKATPHDLRASAITFLFDTGAPIVVIQRLVGHNDPKTTEGYYTRKQDLDNSPVYKIDLNS
jgi:integrase/recombinase XerD